MNNISKEEVLRKLKAKGRPGQLAGMARYGIKTDKRFGVSVPDMRALAKSTGKNHALALELWATGIGDAMIVAAIIDEPAEVTEKQMDDWVKDVDSWDVCDQLCMNLFEKTPLALKKIKEWSSSREEFIKRTAFSMMACIAWHDKTSPDEYFMKFFPLIKKAAADERNYVKKAVSWALRNIGKKNTGLNRVAIKLSKELQKIDSKAARWIASGAIRELESSAVLKRLNK